MLRDSFWPVDGGLLSRTLSIRPTALKPSLPSCVSSSTTIRTSFAMRLITRRPIPRHSINLSRKGCAAAACPLNSTLIKPAPRSPRTATTNPPRVITTITLHASLSSLPALHVGVQAKGPKLLSRPFNEKLAATYSRGVYKTTTIGKTVFDGRVRNGNGSDHSFMATKKRR